MSCYSQFVLVLIILSFVEVQSEGNCTITYITQPLPDLPCNPYHMAFNNLQLECNIASTNSSLKVDWYYRSTNGAAVKIKRTNDKRYSLSNHVSSYADRRYVRSRLLVESVNESDSGYYWCVPVISNEQAGEPCQTTFLRPQNEYLNILPCPNTYLTLPESVCVNDCFFDDIRQSDPNFDLEYSSVYDVLPPTPVPSMVFVSDSESLKTILYVAVPVSIAVLLLIIAILTSCVICCCKKCKKQEKEVHTFTTRKESTGAHFNVPMIRVSDILLRNERQTLPTHLSVARQPSANSEYKELSLKEENQTTTNLAHNSNLTHLPLSHQKSASLPKLSHKKEKSRPYYVNVSDVTIHLNNPVCSSLNSAKRMICRSEHCLAKFEKPFLGLRNTDSSEHYYINHGPPSSPKVYQALIRDTLDEQTLYCQPELIKS